MSAPNSAKPSPNLKRSDVLHHALNSASHSLLLKTLKEICIELPAAEEAVAKKLLTTEDRVRLGSHSSDDSSDVPATRTKPPAPEKAGVKRLRSRYTMCENCGEEYNVENNYRDSCLYHPEDSYPDYDAFVDHDEDCHGIIDTPEMREEFPENFTYACCDRNGEEEPCTVDRHRESVAGFSKRLKMR